MFKTYDPSKEIAIIWSVHDVKAVRPDLNEDQAMEVLQLIKRKHDATIGVTWDTLNIWADYLYPLESEEIK